MNRGPFHKSSYERFLLYELVEPVLSYRSNEFVALTNLCETGPMIGNEATGDELTLTKYESLCQRLADKSVQIGRTVCQSVSW